MNFSKIGIILRHFSAIWIMLILSRLLFQQIGYNMLHALRLRAGVVVAGLRSAPVGAKRTSTGRPAPFQQVNSSPDTETCAKGYDQGL